MRVPIITILGASPFHTPPKPSFLSTSPAVAPFSWLSLETTCKLNKLINQEIIKKFYTYSCLGEPIGKGKEESEKHSREYWNCITDDETGRQMEQLLEYWKLVYWNSILECNAWYYWNIIPKHENPGRQLE